MAAVREDAHLIDQNIKLASELTLSDLPPMYQTTNTMLEVIQAMVKLTVAVELTTNARTEIVCGQIDNVIFKNNIAEITICLSNFIHKDDSFSFKIKIERTPKYQLRHSETLIETLEGSCVRINEDGNLSLLSAFTDKITMAQELDNLLKEYDIKWRKAFETYRNETWETEKICIMSFYNPRNTSQKYVMFGQEFSNEFVFPSPVPIEGRGAFILTPDFNVV